MVKNSEIEYESIKYENLKFAERITEKYIDKLMKLTNSHQSIREIQQNQDNILFVHVLMLGEGLKVSLAIFIIYKEQIYIFICDESTNYVVDHTTLSKEGQIIFSKELLFKNGYCLFLPEMLEDLI